MAVERKYAMVRLGAGDYLLPSNDAQTMWRISKYWEDGSLESHDGKVIKGEFWQASSLTTEQFNQQVEGGLYAFDDMPWVIQMSLGRTRSECVDWALTK
jgi:hypothetical protein